MGQLFDARKRIEQVIAERGLHLPEVRGAICLKSGFLLTLVQQDTPDDPAKLERLRAAAKVVLKIDL